MRRAARTEPISPKDSGWAVTCGEEEDVSTACVWSVAQVVAREPRLAAVLDHLPGAVFEMNHAGVWSAASGESDATS